MVSPQLLIWKIFCRYDIIKKKLSKLLSDAPFPVEELVQSCGALGFLPDPEMTIARLGSGFARKSFLTLFISRAR